MEANVLNKRVSGQLSPGCTGCTQNAASWGQPLMGTLRNGETGGCLELRWAGKGLDSLSCEERTAAERRGERQDLGDAIPYFSCLSRRGLLRKTEWEEETRALGD